MNPLNDKLRQVTLEAFESLCQIFPAAEENAGNVPPPDWTVSVDFSGPIKGTFVIGFHDRLRSAVATAMVEGKLSAPQEQDAIKEIANVICGNILPYIAGPTAMFTLLPPRYAPWPAKEVFPTAPGTVQTSVVFTEGSAQMAVFTS